MSTTPTPFEAKLAKVIYNNLTPLVVGASTHPVFSRLNLHNNAFLKKINHKAKMVYGMSFQPDVLVKAPYDHGGEDNIENALIAINELVSSDCHAGHKEYIFKRIEFLSTEALHALHSRNHQDWLTKISTAIQNAKTNAKVKKETKKKVPTKGKPVLKTKKPIVKRLRNKKGQFISRKR